MNCKISYLSFYHKKGYNNKNSLFHRERRKSPFPQIDFQIHTTISLQVHSFRPEQVFLVFPARCEAPCCIDYPMARVLATIKLSLTEYLSDQAGIFWPTNQTGKLAIGRHAPRGNAIY